MLRLLTVSLFFVIFSFVCVNAQDGIDHGPTGTANLDYFNSAKDPHIPWLINDMRRAHFDKAVRNVGSGRYKDAISELNYILARFVNHPEALALAGIVAKATNNSQWAISNFERALNLYPQYALTHAQYGKFLTDFGGTSAGIEKLDKAIEMDPQLAAAHVWLAAAYAKNGNTQLAQKAAEKARSLGYKGDLTQYGLK